MTKDWMDIRSSVINKVKFIQNKHDLRGDVHVVYKNEKEYKFEDVPGIIFNKMIQSGNPDRYFMGYIRGEFKSEAVK